MNKELAIFLDYEMPPGSDSIREISAYFKKNFPLLSAPETYLVPKAYLLIQTPMITFESATSTRYENTLKTRLVGMF